MKSLKTFAASTKAMFVATLVSVGLLAGCQSPSQSAEGSGNQTMLELTGKTVGSRVIIDDLLTFDVTNQARTQFRLRPGRHHVRIEKQGKVVTDENVSIARGQTLDIAVP